MANEFGEIMAYGAGIVGGGIVTVLIGFVVAMAYRDDVHKKRGEQQEREIKRAEKMREILADPNVQSYLNQRRELTQRVLESMGSSPIYSDEQITRVVNNAIGEFSLENLSISPPSQTKQIENK